MVSKGTVRQTQNSEKPSFHGYESDRCLLPVVRAGVRQIIFLLPITGGGNKAGFDFQWRTVTPSVFYYGNYVFHNLIRSFCVKIARSYAWFLMNADKFYGFLFIHDQLSDNYPTHMDSIIENQHFGLTPFSPPDLNATLSNKKVWSRFTYLY